MVATPATLPVPVVVADEAGTYEDPARRTGAPAVTIPSVLLAVVTTIGLAIVFVALYAFSLSGLQEQRSQHQLYAKFRGLLDPSSPVAPSIGGRIKAGTPVALLDAPRPGLHRVVVVEGTSAGDLLGGPGHLSDTPLPGQAGESIIAGRSTTAGAPFRDLTRLGAGETITVTTGQGTFRYRVLGRLAAGTRPPSVPASSGLLTLVTSAGEGSLSSLSPGHLVYVDAKLEGRAVSAPAGRPITETAADRIGSGDSGAWPWAVGWLLLLAAATAGSWWLWAKWGLSRTWILAAPVLLGILWGLSTEAVRLLPNVY